MIKDIKNVEKVNVISELNGTVETRVSAEIDGVKMVQYAGRFTANGVKDLFAPVSWFTVVDGVIDLNSKKPNNEQSVYLVKKDYSHIKGLFN